MITKQIKLISKDMRKNSYKHTLSKSGTRATKNELVMDLAKTISSSCTSTRETNSIANYWWATRFAQRHHLQFFSSSLRIYYKRLGNEDLFFFIFSLLILFLFSFGLLLSFLFYLLLACQQELYQLAHTRFARNTTRYQVCKVQAIIDELVSIGKISTNGLANK